MFDMVNLLNLVGSWRCLQTWFSNEDPLKPCEPMKVFANMAFLWTIEVFNMHVVDGRQTQIGQN